MTVGAKPARRVSRREYRAVLTNKGINSLQKIQVENLAVKNACA